MADEIRQNTLDIPAGTTPAAPALVDCTFPPRNVTGIEIVVPPGVNGLVGFRILNSGVAVIPYDSDAWIVTNNEVISWPITSAINSGSWQVEGYNTGTNDHTIYFRWLLDYVTTAETATVSPVISADDLAGPDVASDTTLVSLTPGDDTSVDLTGLAN